MYTTTFRQVGSSIMLAIPPALLNTLNLGATVSLSTQDGKLIIERAQPTYTLAQLLQECDKNAPIEPEIQQWVNTPPAGLELI